MYVHACVHCLSMDNLGSLYFLAIANSTTVNMEMNLLSLSCISVILCAWYTCCFQSKVKGEKS